MNRFHRFIRRQKENRYHLAFYFDFEIENPSPSYKEKLTTEFQKLIKGTFPTANPKFYISGPGYGFSKGSPDIGEKALKNRFQKKGFGNCLGLYINDEKIFLSSGITTQRPNEPGQFAYIGFQKTDVDLNKFLPAIVNKLMAFVNLQYGYGFSCYPDFSHMSEMYPKRTLFSSYFPINKEGYKWRSKLHLIEEGKIKKLHPFNILNPKQLKELEEIEFDEMIELKGDLKIGIIKRENLENNVKKIQNNIL